MANPRRESRERPKVLSPTHAPLQAILGLYHRHTRGARFAVLMVVGLLAIYEFGVLATGATHRNAADLLLRDFLLVFGPRGPAIFHGALLIGFMAAAVLTVRRGQTRMVFLPFFFAECAFYAAALAPAILWISDPFLMSPHVSSLVLDVGAGVYEELVFRFIFIRGLFALIRLDPWTEAAPLDRAGVVRAPAKVTSASRSAPAFHAGAILVIVLSSALAFAAYHHWGLHAEPFRASVFMFRVVAGLVLALIYLARGLATAVYTHAFYDVFVHFITPVS